MKHWSHLFDDSHALENLTFPIEFLFVFALRDFVKKYEVRLEDIRISSITFPRESRVLENGEHYQESMRGAWITSDLKPLTKDEIEKISDKNCFFEMSKRFYKARDDAKKRILQIDLLVGESVVEVYQDLSVLFRVNNREIREWYSAPVGFCLYKARPNSGIF